MSYFVAYSGSGGERSEGKEILNQAGGRFTHEEMKRPLSKM
jgi:hypothetical protein